MKGFMFGGGAVLFLAGVPALFSTKSDIQIIIAVLCFGFGLLAFGLAGVIARLAPTLAAPGASTVQCPKCGKQTRPGRSCEHCGNYAPA